MRYDNYLGKSLYNYFNFLNLYTLESHKNQLIQECLRG